LLINKKGEKPTEIHIPYETWIDIIKITHCGIVQKLNAVKTLIHNEDNKVFSAGLYTFALEEFGKLLLLEKCQKIANDKVKIYYKNEFASHDKKFETAINFLRRYSDTSYKCYVLSKGSYSPKTHSWRTFMIGLVAGINTRLSILYSDFSYTTNKTKIQEITIQKQLNVEMKYLVDAINELSKIIMKWPLPD
jgi:hypothetical protein